MGWGIRDILGGDSAGAGLLKMLAQLRVPSGFELAFGNSAVGADPTSGTTMFSHDASITAFSVSLGCSVPNTIPSVFPDGSRELTSPNGSELLSTCECRKPFVVDPPRPPRPPPRPRSEPRPRFPRTPSSPPLPRPLLDALWFISPEGAPVSFDLERDRSFVFFLTSPH